MFLLFLSREQQIMSKWQQLMDLLEKKKKILMGFSELLGMFREIESIGIEMADMEVCNLKYLSSM